MVVIVAKNLPTLTLKGQKGASILKFKRTEAVLKICASLPVVAPRRKPRGPSSLMCLGMTSRSAVPNEARRDAVPSEARDASLSLSRTK